MDSIDDLAATFAIQVYLLSIEVLEKNIRKAGGLISCRQWALPSSIAALDHFIMFLHA